MHLDKISSEQNQIDFANVFQANEHDWLYVLAYITDLFQMKDPQQFRYIEKNMELFFNDCFKSKESNVLIKSFPSVIKMTENKRQPRKTLKRLSESDETFSSKKAKFANSDLLLEQDVWLTSSHIMVALTNIKKNYPDYAGFDDTLRFQNPSFVPNIIRNKTVFVFHVLNHWVTVTNIDFSHHHNDKEVWFLYDSLQNKTYYNKTLQILKRIRQQDILLVNSPCHIQNGTNDCGLFAIANTLNVVNGICPSNQSYKQEEMRKHFNECVRNNEFVRFPIS